MVTERFVNLAQHVAKGQGMPSLPMVVLPANVDFLSPEELRTVADKAFSTESWTSCDPVVVGELEQARRVARRSGTSGMRDDIATSESGRDSARRARPHPILDARSAAIVAAWISRHQSPAPWAAWGT